jgi:hypothetical protein
MQNNQIFENKANTEEQSSSLLQKQKTVSIFNIYTSSVFNNTYRPQRSDQAPVEATLSQPPLMFSSAADSNLDILNVYMDCTFSVDILPTTVIKSAYEDVADESEKTSSVTDSSSHSSITSAETTTESIDFSSSSASSSDTPSVSESETLSASSATPTRRRRRRDHLRSDSRQSQQTTVTTREPRRLNKTSKDMLTISKKLADVLQKLGNMSESTTITVETTE